MKQSVTVIFGKEQVSKIFNGEILNEDELLSYVKKYDFNTIEEKRAFIKGLDEALGWTEFYIPEIETRILN